MLSSKLCVGNAEHPETDAGICKHYKEESKCAEVGCHWNKDVVTKNWRGKKKIGACQVKSEVYTSFLEVEAKTEAMARLQAVTRHLHEANAFHDPEAFAHNALMSKDSFVHMATGVTSFLQMSAVAGDASTSQAVRSYLYERGIVALPNQCVNNEAFGKAFGIAINFENPSLLEALMLPPFSLVKAIPELLVAIFPLTVRGNTIDDKCLAGRVHCEDAVTPKGVARNCHQKASQDLDEQYVQSAMSEIDREISGEERVADDSSSSSSSSLLQRN